jgi:hypothetical protein
MIARFKKGPRHAVDHLNEMVDQINLNAQVIGGGAIQSLQTMQGRVNFASIEQINPRIPKRRGGSNFKVFRVVSEATGDGVYNCYEQTLDATEWVDTSGDPKFDDKNTDSIEVLNLAEFDPEATYVAHLATSDLLLAWPMADDEGNSRYIGVPFRKDNADRPRVAYVKTAPGATTTVTCYLDTDGTGREITVSCFIAQGGGALNAAIPLLADGDGIMVSKVGGTWRCLTTFQPTETCDCYSAS